jgi:hypothetical protein
MVFYVFLCLTVRRECLLNRNLYDTVAVITLDTLLREKNDKIFQIIDKVLKQVFGEEATRFIYDYLEQHYSLRQSDFSKRIDVFAKGLEDCLSSGAFAVENRILDDISAVYGAFNKIGFERKPERYDFASQMKIAIQRA